MDAAARQRRKNVNASVFIDAPPMMEKARSRIPKTMMLAGGKPHRLCGEEGWCPGAEPQLAAKALTLLGFSQAE